jgi:hypothetical protein
MTPIELSEESIPWEALGQPEGGVPRMKMRYIPLLWRVQGWVAHNWKGPPLKTEAFYPSPRGDFPRLPFQLIRR